MENFKFIVFSIIILLVVAIAGYWSFTTLETGGEHINKQQIKDLQKENEILQKEVSSLTDQIDNLQESVIPEEEPTKLIPEEVKVPPTNPNNNQNIVSKYQSLINDLQKLINDKVYMKKGSKGTRVGTVQEFLNIYNKTSNKIDNDYGPSMETAIKKFQTEQKVTSDGEAGPGTFSKMIDWLKKQS